MIDFLFPLPERRTENEDEAVHRSPCLVVSTFELATSWDDAFLDEWSRHDCASASHSPSTPNSKRYIMSLLTLAFGEWINIFTLSLLFCDDDQSADPFGLATARTVRQAGHL